MTEEERMTPEKRLCYFPIEDIKCKGDLILYPLDSFSENRKNYVQINKTRGIEGPSLFHLILTEADSLLE